LETASPWFTAETAVFSGAYQKKLSICCVLEIRLSSEVAGARRIRLRALEGRDELNLDPQGRSGFCDFLDGLTVKANDGCVPPGRVRELAVCDLEAIAATLQCVHYGDRVERSLQCARCGRGFELSFDLGALVEGLGKHRHREINGPDENGVFTLRDGRQFRLPTGTDELAVADLDAAEAASELRSRCVLHGDFESDPEVLDASMKSCGPLISQELHASCPHCRAIQIAQFHVRRFFLEALASERQFLNREVHYLARSYGWSRAEILGMNREDRRLHVQLLLPGT
jgi:hypothetical protein